MADKKEVWSLNPVEQIAYEGLKQAFVCGFMVKDLLTCEKKEE